MPLSIGVLKETFAHEARVALTPDVAAKFADLGVAVHIESGAGERSHLSDALFKGAQFHEDAASVLRSAHVLLKVQAPTLAEVEALEPGAVVIGFLQPHRELDLVRALRDRRLTSFAVELIPRISRAQSMDALSSQAAAAGYKAALLAASALDKFFPMLTTAAGTIRPAQVLVIGAGVAGLQAIATARRLGAIVEAYDVRSATKEQIQSLGAKFVDTGVAAEGTGGYARELTAEEKAKQQEILDRHIAKADVVITTAAVPGRTAPRIISKSAVAAMSEGAVIVDLAAESGGNCELTAAGETVVTPNGVKVIGPRNLPSELARHAQSAELPLPCHQERRARDRLAGRGLRAVCADARWARTACAHGEAAGGSMSDALL
jgi:NAD(P) transhydrogenase subunit alpha